ncbi:two-component response regulator [Halalkalibacter wakoensis JCM 9140]|uniref:Two-component response regulator n=1 Tax=Halalkalibacter wakoensis JCM 9140 TaxID=1236970 RepID=W4Q0K0_9BACI|nr:two-component response regulator [Halalkalibacter wakoensis JCM 9140]
MLTFIVKGFSNKEIAEQLFISVKTVETHKSNIMVKLELKTRPELVEYAVKKGLLVYEA